MKRIISIITCFAILFLAASCGASKEISTSTDATTSAVTATSTNEANDVREPIKISMYYNGAPNQYLNWEDSEYGKEILKKLNATIEVEYVASDNETKEGLMIAAGTYPDVLVGTQTTQKFIDNKVVIPLQDLYSKYGKNLKFWYDQNDTMKDYTIAGANDIYLLPLVGHVKVDDGYQAGSGYMIQAKVLKESGWPKITTVEQYFKLIEDYKKKNPTINGKPTIGYTIKSDSWQFDSISNNPTELLFGFRDDGGYLNEKDEAGKYTTKVVSGSKYEKEYLQFMNGIFAKGLVDKEGFVEKGDQWSAKMSSGRVLGYFGWWYEIPPINQALKDQGMEDRQFVEFPLVWKEDIQEKWWAASENEANKGICITKSCQNPERVFQFFDDLMDQDNIKRIGWGEEGVDYSVNSEGQFELTDAQAAKLSQDTSYLQNKGITPPGFMPGLQSDCKYSDGNLVYARLNTTYLNSQTQPIVKEYLKAYGYNVPGDAYKMFTTDYGFSWSISIPANDVAGKASAKKSDINRQMIPKLLMGKASDFDKYWGEYTEKLVNAKIPELEKFIQDAVNKRISLGRKSE